MDWKDWMDTQIKDQIAARVATGQLESVAKLPTVASEGAPNGFSDEVTAAIDLVSEAAEAIKCADNRAFGTTAQAQKLASAAAEKIRLAEARIERAETAKHQAEADLAAYKAQIERLKGDFEQAEARIADKVGELAAAEQHAAIAEQRANDAEAALKAIAHAIRTQLPGKNEIVVQQASTKIHAAHIR